MEKPKSSSIFAEELKYMEPIQRVRFTESVLRHADIPDHNPLLGMICADDLQRNLNVPKIEDQSQEERRSGKTYP